MTSTFSTYFAWAAPNTLPAVAAAAAVAWLVGWIRGYGPIPPSALNIILPLGAAAIIVLAISVSLAVLGVQPTGYGDSFGIFVGALFGLLLAPKRA